MGKREEDFVNFVRSFNRITWTRVTKTICMVPGTLLLILLMCLIVLAVDHKGAVVSDSASCAIIGKNVLSEGGSAVDAAIAMLLCEGVALPSSAGIGGGFTAIIYANGKFDSIVAGPSVPVRAGQTIWSGRDLKGARAVGVPGELLGYWEMHRKYGSLSWKRLFQPAIELCKNGVQLTHWTANIIRHSSDKIDKSPTMDAILPYWTRERNTKDYKLKFPKLAKTLEVLAKDGVTAFYQGNLGRDFVADIQKGGGYITMQDLKAYKVIWDSKPPLTRMRSKFKVVTTPLPTYGAVTVLILNIIKNLPAERNISLFWHKFVEASKHAYGRSTKLGDPFGDPNYMEPIMDTYNKMLDQDFARHLRWLIRDNTTFDDPGYYGAPAEPNYAKGSANVCVLSPAGDAVAATTSLLSHFGAFYASNRTGIIGNNLLKTFINYDIGALQILPANRPIPGKQALLPYSPVIVLDKKLHPYFIASASGGAHAPTIIATAIIKYVLFQRTAFEAIFPAYLHNQLFPNRVEIDSPIADDILRFLKSVGHKVVRKKTSFENYTSAICIGVRNLVPEMQFGLHTGGSKETITPANYYGLIFSALMLALTLGLIGSLLYQLSFSVGMYPQL